MRSLHTIGRVAASVILVTCFLVLMGAQVFGLPYLSPLGSTVLLLIGPWLVVAPLAIGVLEIWGCRASHWRTALLRISIAAAATGCASVAIVRMVAEFHHHNVPLDWIRTFGIRLLPGWPPDEDQLYETWQDQALHLLVYKPSSTKPTASTPILLYIHGGGFTVGDRFESGANLRWFADRGWLVLSIDYSLSSADRHLWDTTTGQVACALVWTAANAARLGGDPARISLLGSSAGGNLAINTAYLANAGKLQSSCPGTPPRVSAVSALYPAVDLVATWESNVPGLSDMARQFDANYLGGSPQQYSDRYRIAASATHINAAAPPTLIILGDHDHLVPPDATDSFVRQAHGAGIDIQSIRFPYADHGFNLNQFGLGNQFYLGMTERFLRQQGQGPTNFTSAGQ